MNVLNQNKTNFLPEEEEELTAITKSVQEKVDFSLRKVIAVTHKIQAAVATGKKNEFGEPIEDWNKVSTHDLINLFSEAAALNYFSTPVRLQAFIEFSLAEIVKDYYYSKALTDPTLTGTVQTKTALASMTNQDNNFVCTFRKLYSTAVTEQLKTFDAFLRRLEKIIDWRQAEDKQNPFVYGKK